MKSDRSGSVCSRAVRTPSVTTSSRVVGAEPAVEAHLPSDLAADRPAALFGNSRGDRAGGHPAGLKQNDPAVCDERGRDARCFAGAGRGGDDRGPRPADAIDDLIEERIDRERNHGTLIAEYVADDSLERPELCQGLETCSVVRMSLRLITVTRSRRRRPGSSRRCRRGRSSRPGSWRGTAGDSPRRSRTRAPAGSPW